MNPTESYLRKTYENNRWPYLPLIKTKTVVGETFETDIRELKTRGMVRPVPGVNGWLIQILEWNTLWNQKQ